MVENIPLSRLYCRQDMDSAPAAQGTGIVTELANSILRLGLKSPLVVQATKQGRIYRVIEGSLRLAAMRQLCVRERIDKRNYTVQCMVQPYDSDYEKQLREAQAYRAAAPRPLFPWQQRVLDECAKRKLFAVSTPSLGKTIAVDFENQFFDESSVLGPIVHRDFVPEYRQAEGRSWRVGFGTYVNPDWASFEMQLMQKFAALPTTIRVFDLGDRW